MNPRNLAGEPDFDLGGLGVSPSTCRVFAGGNPVRVEAQTMAVLVVLAKADGGTVGRQELIDACWQGRIVSDDAVAQTIAKVRALARAVTPSPFSLETLPKVGFRLIPAVSLATAGNGTSKEADFESAKQASQPQPAARTLRRRWLPIGVIGGVAAIPVCWVTLAGVQSVHPQPSVHIQSDVSRIGGMPHASEVADALLSLDGPRLKTYLQGGWDPSWYLDSERNTALHILMLVCERNRTHDKAALVSLAQQLLDAGANPDARNEWRDTPLIIAKDPKYCGPDHPIVAFLRAKSGADADKR